MNEIIIDGYNLEGLKKIQAAVKKDASAIIAVALEKGTALVEEILAIEPEGDDEEYSAEQCLVMGNLSKEANQQLEIVKLVSGLSDVQYYMDFNNNYDSNGDALSTKLNYKFDGDVPECLEELANLVEDMEWSSYQWHNSNC